MSELVAALRNRFTAPFWKSPSSKSLRWTTLWDWPLGLSALMFAWFIFVDPSELNEASAYVWHSILHIAPYFLAAVLMAAYVQASNADRLIARAFSENKWRSIAFAALLGGLSPFCSCGVIPLVVALLAAGVPLSPVMAFLIASPLMDPEMFAISTGAIGLEFTVGRTIVAIFGGLLAASLTVLLDRVPVFADPLKEGAKPKSCCGSQQADPLAAQSVNWRFWRQPGATEQFLTEFRKTGWFLGRWMIFAFTLSAVMIAYVPPTIVSDYLGSGAWWTVPAAVLIGFPMYLNGYAATPLVAELLNFGMAPGAAMAFLTAGSVACVPSLIAVAGVVKRQVLALYLGLGVIVALVAGIGFQAYVGLAG